MAVMHSAVRRGGRFGYISTLPKVLNSPCSSSLWGTLAVKIATHSILWTFAVASPAVFLRIHHWRTVNSPQGTMTPIKFVTIQERRAVWHGQKKAIKIGGKPTWYSYCGLWSTKASDRHRSDWFFSLLRSKIKVKVNVENRILRFIDSNWRTGEKI